MLKPLFDKSNGKITSLGWSQYTPYFNDGDSCEFSLNINLDYGILVNGKSLDEGNFFKNNIYRLEKYLKADGSYEKWIKDYPEDELDVNTVAENLFLYEILKEFTDVLESIDEDFFKNLFGDHVTVTVFFNETIETEEYDHD
jgi:hypothetical protein